jgi:pimeloyl-ACP methyl ester carboxylesterase
MILGNPGGPGGSGISFLFELASFAVPILGSNFDLVSWDPRGIGYALPSANCTLSGNLTTPALKRRAFDKIYGPELAPEYFENNYAVDYQAAKDCGSSIGGPQDAGPHMTTATVARDMISILDAYAESEEGKNCEEDASLLNYWGISYGTIIGQTFASMFPDRVGRVVLDGVVDPDAWATGYPLTSITLTDDVFSTFFLYCSLAGPSLCPFYTGTTPHDIYLRFETIVNQLNATYAFQQNWSNSTAIELVLRGVKELIFSWSYSPIEEFPNVARLLLIVEDLLTDLSLAAVEAVEKEVGIELIRPLTVNELWTFAVICTDNGGVEYGLTLQDFAGDIRALESQSWLAGEGQAADKFFCAGWDIRTDDRYAGLFPFPQRWSVLITF